MLVGCASADRRIASTAPASAPACHDVAPIDVAALPAQGSAASSAKSSPEFGPLMRQGADAYACGEFGSAIALWKRAADAGRDADRVDALLAAGSAEESLGSLQDAAATIADALPIAIALHDSRRQIETLGALGTVYTFARHFSAADAAISRAQQLASETQDERSGARLLISRGMLLGAEGNLAEAATAFHQAGDRTANPLTRARAGVNEALALLCAGQLNEPLYEEVSTQLLALPDSRDKASLMITHGRTMVRAGGLHPSPNHHSAAELYSQAAGIAERLHDPVLLSLAVGYQGELAEFNHNADALPFTRRALFLASEAGAPDVLYRWQWQLGRVLQADGQRTAAIETYGDAIETLKKIHGDLAAGLGNSVGIDSYRDSVGPVYYEMADLLLRQADASRDPAEVQRLLRRARDTVELLKSGELEDYFQKKCVNLVERHAIDEAGERGTAIVYLIPLADRTELLLSTSHGMIRATTAIGSAELTGEVREFRERLEDRTSNRYLKNARKLYDWIIRPIEPILTSQKIDTLVFVPDGALRTIPMAALNDGKEFLIAHYAIAITPGLTLMGTPSGEGSAVSVLEGGISKSVAPFPALEFVPQELAGIQHLYGGVQLMDGTFTKSQLTEEMRDRKFTIVHLASHAEFSHDRDGTFLLTYPDRMAPGATREQTARLSLAELGQLLNPSRYRDQPVELLTLSACQTAAGDDRAALGLAGIALEMGARSAVATLWSVNDQASADLVEKFYSSLQANPRQSKARAMQLAQLRVMADARYRHPCYWAPFLVIGNWKPFQQPGAAVAQK